VRLAYLRYLRHRDVETVSSPVVPSSLLPRSSLIIFLVSPQATLLPTCYPGRIISDLDPRNK
jgi:hypothetical protein